MNPDELASTINDAHDFMVDEVSDMDLAALSAKFPFLKDFSNSFFNVLDKRSRILEVVVVRRIINLGAGNLEWGGKGKGLRKGRSVYE